MYASRVGADGVYQEKGGGNLNNKKVSVCLPFYNIEPYVSRCLDSVLGNTYQNLEVICVNDGSTDGTSALLHEYAKKDPRVIVIDKENAGLVSARQAAIGIATGDFLSFIDGDDWVHPQFFEVLLTVQEKTGAEAVVCNYASCAEFTEPHEIEADKVPFQVADNLSLLNDWHARTHIWGRIYSRKLSPHTVVPRNINMGEDTAFNLSFLCSEQDACVARVAEALYYYFQREDSIVHTVSHADKIDVALFFVEQYDAIKNTDKYGIVLHEILRNMLTYRYLTSFSGDQNSIRKACRSIYDFCKENWAGSFSAKEKVKYSILYYCPFVYRLFRIITDPTMLDWERAEKKRQQERAE